MVEYTPLVFPKFIASVAIGQDEPNVFRWSYWTTDAINAAPNSNFRQTITVEPKNYTGKLSVNTVTASIPRDLDLEESHGINHEVAVHNTLRQESKNFLIKTYVEKLREVANRSTKVLIKGNFFTKLVIKFKNWFFNNILGKEFRPTLNIESSDDFIRVCHILGTQIISVGAGHPDNIIVNTHIGTILSNNDKFKVVGCEDTFMGSLYQIGKIGGFIVWVDPNMVWEDYRVLLFKKPIENEAGVYLAFKEPYIDKTTPVGNTIKYIAYNRFDVFELPGAECLAKEFKINPKSNFLL